MTILGDVAAIVDCEHKTAPIDESGDYYAVGTPAMRGNTIDFGEARRISTPTFDAWTRRMRPAFGDILFAREAPVGPVVRIPREENVAPGQRTVLIRPDLDRVEPRYLYYLLASHQMQSLVQTLAAGSTVPHLNVADVRTLNLGELPDLTTQRSVAGTLGALDDKIAVNRRMMITGRSLLMAYWTTCVTGALNTVRLAEVAEITPSVRTSKPDSAPYLDMKNLPEHGLLVSECGRREPRGGARFRNGDTLVARITPCFENGKMGWVDFLENEEIGYGSTEFIVLRARSGIPGLVPYVIAASSSFRAFAAQHRTGTSGRQRVQATELANFRLRLPNADVLAQFGMFADRLTSRLGAARTESQRLAATRDELLPLLMSGRITIKDAEQRVEQEV